MASKTRPSKRVGKLPDEETIARKLTAYLNQRGYMNAENLTIALGMPMTTAAVAKVHEVAKYYAPYVQSGGRFPMYSTKPRYPGHEPNPNYNQEPKEGKTVALQRTAEELEAALSRALELLPKAEKPTVEWVRKQGNLSTSWLYAQGDRIDRVKAAVQKEKARREEALEAVADEPIPYVLVPQPEALPGGEPEIPPVPIEKGGEELELDLGDDQAADYERQIADLQEQVQALKRELSSQVPVDSLVQRYRDLVGAIKLLRREIAEKEKDLDQKLDDAQALRRTLDLLEVMDSEEAA